MGIFAKIFGICSTPKPADAGCWSFADGKLEIDLNRAAELSMPGGSVRIESKSLPSRVLVARAEDGEYHAFANRCTHVGHRRLDHLPKEGKVKCCSVGESTFDYHGCRLSGSATEPIKPFRVEKNGDKLTVWLE